jgi:hypothetical protein
MSKQGKRKNTPTRPPIVKPPQAPSSIVRDLANGIELVANPTMAGDDFNHALSLGAFAGDKYRPLRDCIDETCEKIGRHGGATFAAAVHWLRRNKPHFSPVNWQKVFTENDGCLLLAAALRSEADAMEKAEDAKTAGAAAGSKADTRTPVETTLPTEDKARMSAHDLAVKYSLSENALYHRLKHWRTNHDDGWYEVADTGRNEPRILYQTGSVMPVIKALQDKAARQTNGRQKKI